MTWKTKATKVNEDKTLILLSCPTLKRLNEKHYA